MTPQPLGRAAVLIAEALLLLGWGAGEIPAAASLHHSSTSPVSRLSASTESGRKKQICSPITAPNEIGRTPRRRCQEDELPDRWETGPSALGEHIKALGPSRRLGDRQESWSVKADPVPAAGSLTLGCLRLRLLF